MSNLMRLQKRLDSPPEPGEVPGITLRTFNGPADAEAWLALRTATFAGMLAGDRPWNAADFAREFTAKPWWSPQRMWFAIEEASRERQRSESVAGSITLGRAGRSPHEQASVQWLMVAPAYRNRGIGRRLLAALEQAAWSLGERVLTLETHASWDAAVRLYQAAGYRPQ